jgi:hypothetical protein
VEKIRSCQYFYSNKSECLYSGVELTKTGVPKKKSRDNEIFQSNIKMINGIDYEITGD